MQWQALTVHLRDLAIRNGFTADGEGGAIHMIGGTPASLVISGCEFINNKSRWDGGAIRTTGIDLRISNSVADFKSFQAHQCANLTCFHFVHLLFFESFKNIKIFYPRLHHSLCVALHQCDLLS